MSTAACPSVQARRVMALPGAGGSDAKCCARLCRQQSQECAGMPSSRLSRQHKSSGAFHVHCSLAQRAGARAWRCRVQAALMLSAAPRLCRQQSQECPAMAAGMHVQSLSRQQKSSGAFHVHCCMAQRAGARAWRCRVQAALMLSAAPEYAGNSLRSVLECCSVAEQTAEIVRSISCPLQHGPTCGREGLALPGAGGSDAQCCARICRQQSQECAGMLCSR